MAAYSADDDGWQTCKPDMIIGSKNRVRGDIKFDGLLRVDGTIEGRITAPMESRIVISPGGCFLGDLTGLAAAYIDGKVVGDVSVERLVLGSQAAVHGDVTCRALRIEGGASIVGLLTVSPKAAVPSEYDEHRSLVDVLEDPLDGFSLEEDDGGDGDEGSGSPVRSASRHDSPSPAASRSSSPMRPARRDYRVVLLVLEPQVDFYPGGSCGPGFPLVDLGMGGGGEQELGADGSAMQRLSDAILLNMEGIDEIVISLDSHNVRPLYPPYSLLYLPSPATPLTLLPTPRPLSLPLFSLILSPSPTLAAHPRCALRLLERQAGKPATGEYPHHLAVHPGRHVEAQEGGEHGLLHRDSTAAAGQRAALRTTRRRGRRYWGGCGRRYRD